MSEKKRFDQGYGTSYSTRPTGLTTYLLIQPYFDGKGVSDDTTCTWHIELCHEPDHDHRVTEKDDTIKVNISAAGALVSVRNTGGWPFYAWTDY
jgi:hypothetical protein